MTDEPAANVTVGMTFDVSEGLADLDRVIAKLVQIRDLAASMGLKMHLRQLESAPPAAAATAEDKTDGAAT